MCSMTNIKCLPLPEPLGMQIALSTHAIGGLSRFDVVLAAKVDALPVDYSPKWLQQQGKA